MFEVVETNQYFTVVYHKETKVMYAVSSNYSHNNGVVTLLVDENGKPLLYKGEK